MASVVINRTSRAWKIADKAHDLLRVMVTTDQATPVYVYCASSEQVPAVLNYMERNAKREGCIVEAGTPKRVSAHVNPNGALLYEAIRVPVRYTLPA